MCDDMFDDFDEGEDYGEDFMDDEPSSNEWDGIDNEFREPSRKTVSRINEGPKTMDWEEFAFALGLGYEMGMEERRRKGKR